MWKKWKNLFYYSKSDRRVLFFLCGFVSGGALCALIFLYDKTEKHSAHSNETVMLHDILCDSINDSITDTSLTYYVEEIKPETFCFDPNTADSTQLLRLGLSPWQVRNIYKYRASGGRYHRPEDFSCLYGLTKGDYERLLPYIRIADEFKLLSDIPQYKSEIYAEKDPAIITARKNRIEKYEEGVRIDLNKADTVMLKKIPGIGSYYASCIIKYRERLGGFFSLSQLKEIEGLPEDIDKWFEKESLQPYNKLKINSLTLSELRRHPYLNFYMSKAIVEHRRKYGPIRNIESLSLYEEFSESDLIRLKPYLSFE